MKSLKLSDASPDQPDELLSETDEPTNASEFAPDEDGGPQPHAMALRDLLTSAPESWRASKTAKQILTLLATSRSDDDPRVRLSEPADNMTGAPVLFHIVEDMALSNGRLARLSTEAKVRLEPPPCQAVYLPPPPVDSGLVVRQVELLRKLMAHGASWDQINSWDGAEQDEKHSALDEARKHFSKLFGALDLASLAGES